MISVKRLENVIEPVPQPASGWWRLLRKWLLSLKQQQQQLNSTSISLNGW